MFTKKIKDELEKRISLQKMAYKALEIKANNDEERLYKLAQLVWGKYWPNNYTTKDLEHAVSEILVANTRLRTETRLHIARGNDMRGLVRMALCGYPEAQDIGGPIDMKGIAIEIKRGPNGEPEIRQVK